MVSLFFNYTMIGFLPDCFCCEIQDPQEIQFSASKTFHCLKYSESSMGENVLRIERGAVLDMYCETPSIETILERIRKEDMAKCKSDIESKLKLILDKTVMGYPYKGDDKNG